MSRPSTNNKLARAPQLNLAVPRRKDALTAIDRDELVAGWQQSALGVLDEIELRRREGTLTPRDWKDLTIAGGVSTEKALLAAGQPTEIVANMHAHRHDVSPLMDKLAAAARVLVTHQRRDRVKITQSPAADDAPLTHIDTMREGATS